MLSAMREVLRNVCAPHDKCAKEGATVCIESDPAKP